MDGNSLRTWEKGNAYISLVGKLKKKVYWRIQTLMRNNTETDLKITGSEGRVWTESIWLRIWRIRGLM